jgi:hypothetical protein
MEGLGEVKLVCEENLFKKVKTKRIVKTKFPSCGGVRGGQILV